MVVLGWTMFLGAAAEAHSKRTRRAIGFGKLDVEDMWVGNQPWNTTVKVMS